MSLMGDPTSTGVDCLESGRLPPKSTLFPYTTLFRSDVVVEVGGHECYVGRDTVQVLDDRWAGGRSEEHTSELQSHVNLVCRLLLEKNKIDLRQSFGSHRPPLARQHANLQPPGRPNTT